MTTVTRLRHLGMRPQQVPRSIVLVEKMPSLGRALAQLPGASRLGSRREYLHYSLPLYEQETLLTTGCFGSPPLAIALHELAQSGAKRIVWLGVYEAVNMRANDEMIVPIGAVRDDGVTAHYAPPDYPAVPSQDLASRLAKKFGGCRRELVYTTDVPALARERVDGTVAAIDRSSAALFIVGASLQLDVAALLLPASADITAQTILGAAAAAAA